MPTHVKISGAWKKINALHVKVSGAWKQANQGYAKVAGAWKAFLTQLLAGNGGTISAFDAVSPYNSNVAIRFNVDGTVEKGTSTNGAPVTWTPHGSWIDPESEASGNFSVRYTNRVGSSDFTSKAAAEDVWIAISSVRSWVMNKTTLGTFSFDCDFQVRDDVTSLAQATKGYTFIITHTV